MCVGDLMMNEHFQVYVQIVLCYVSQWENIVYLLFLWKMSEVEQNLSTYWSNRMSLEVEVNFTIVLLSVFDSQAEEIVALADAFCLKHLTWVVSLFKALCRSCRLSCGHFHIHRMV